MNKPGKPVKPANVKTRTVEMRDFTDEFVGYKNLIGDEICDRFLGDEKSGMFSPATMGIKSELSISRWKGRLCMKMVVLSSRLLFWARSRCWVDGTRWFLP